MSSPIASALPSDAEIRRAVLDTERSWMLQAPAGSGKTELLMQRFLACMATVEQPESVLAITFTRKAATEMRSRILAALKRASELSGEQIAECKPHERESLRLARGVLDMSMALGWNILEYPARLQVRTLDSFCESVAQRAPFKGMLGGVAQVTEDAQPLYELAAQRVIDQLAEPGRRGDAVAALLVHLDNDVRGVRSLLAAMLAQRDQWLHFLGRSDVFDVEQQEILKARLESAFVFAVDEELGEIQSSLLRILTPAQKSEVLAWIRYAKDQLANAATAPKTEMEAVGANAGVVPIDSSSSYSPDHFTKWPAESAKHIKTWRAICDFLLTSDRSKPALRKTVTVRNGFPSGTTQERTRRKRCIEFFGELTQSPGSEELCVALNRIRHLPDPHYTQSQWQFMLAVLELLPLAAAHLKVVFSEQGTIDFPEYAERALEAIGNHGDPTELGLQLGYKIRHILVDEFQDTNRVQVDLLARLLSTWEEDEHCSTFYVGDPMQSIYSFRQADVAIYQQARKAGIGGREHNFERLTQNFRSQQNLVDWFNEIFPALLREDSDLTNAVQYAAAVPSRPALAGAAVFIKGFASEDRAEEAKYIAECIKHELVAPTPVGEEPSKIAVLVRSRTHLPELVEALHEEGISYRAVKTDRLSDRQLVRDLEALRTALSNLADRTAWLAVLRAPWCGLALADLLELCRADERSTVRELLHQRIDQLSVQARAALSRCLPVLDDALAQYGRASLRRLIESTWLRLGGPACLENREQGIRDSEAYFTLLDAQSSAGMVRDSETFRKKLHDLFAPSDNRSGIRVEIMPIHQAKGLEWDVVFLPALERRARQDDKSLLYWRLRRRGEEEFLLLGPMEAKGKKGEKEATIESYLRDIASDCSREELKRLFYVAATRARKRLYLSAAVPDARQPEANSVLRLLWEVPAIRQEFTPAAKMEVDLAEGEKARQEMLVRRLSTTYQAPEAPRPLVWNSSHNSVAESEHRFEWVGDLLPRIGVVAHRFLQRIAAEGPRKWNAARVAAVKPAIIAALLRAGVMRADLEQAAARVSDALTRTLGDERGRWLLSAHSGSRSELAVSAEVDGHLEHVRVDRTFIEDGIRWLVDYKITEQQGGDRQRFMQMQVEKYRPDMQRYVRVLRAFDPRPMRCALYLPLLGEFCPVEIENP